MHHLKPIDTYHLPLGRTGFYAFELVDGKACHIVREFSGYFSIAEIEAILADMKVVNQFSIKS